MVLSTQLRQKFNTVSEPEPPHFLRLRLRANCFGGSGSGSGSDQNVSAPAAPAPAPAPHPCQNLFLHPCRYDPSTAFLCYQCTTAYPFDGTLTTGEIGGCEFSNPVASALNTFLNPYSYCVLSDPLHWVTEPAPLDEDHNISLFFFTENLCYSGTITPSTIFWTFMTIHNSSQSHYHII